MSLSSERRKILEQLPSEEQKPVRHELVLEMARLKIQWQMNSPPPDNIRLVKSLPITSSLTEAALIDELHEMGNAYILADTKLHLALPFNH